MNLIPSASRLLFATARIVAQQSGGTESIGTAFFFHFKIDDQTSMPVLVTNKHVVEGANRGIFFVHEALRDEDDQIKPSVNSFAFSIQNFGSSWTGHPDPDVDLCAMPFASLAHQALAVGKQIFYIPLDESIIPTQAQLEDLIAMEDITMVGYPIGIWDEVNNFPILRHGITASHPATNFQGKSVGIVDIAAFPGSSGSPIIILNQGIYAKSDGNITVGFRLLFLGILYAGPQFKADGRYHLNPAG